ncbi:PqiC family protein [Desulfopila aestuarii]|uniref:ABC-type transport auxiliary lipoprotein component domain-containing protein n=1 Tax=Desulfopila aestuarii DSM 18488 TaxID=1121416 RepID=A0A1M7Y425_9BACT|nr:PqiC family protein [Desulfopila aestuarii]SHO47002.1 hypothetical protein SAMN02745220_01727 [Desulfopila aestuarii DSM 18488]
MIYHIKPLLLAIPLLMLLTSSGCSLRSTPAINYFSLLSLEQLGSTVKLADSSELKIGIGPVTLAEALSRSQIATRMKGNQFAFDEYNRWAGPLEENLATTIGNNLVFLLGAGGVDYYPWRQYFRPTHRIVIAVERLDGELGAEAVLEVRWSVVSPDGKKTLKEKRSVYRRTMAGSGYPDLVMEESLLVGDLCREIAQALIQ